MTRARMAAAMGTITVSDRDCSILKMPPFHSCGVVPTSEAISPTLVFTVLNRPERFPMMPSIKMPFSQSPMRSPIMRVHLLSRALPVPRGRGGDYFRFHVVSVVTVRTGPGPSAQQPGQQGNEGQADQGDTTARDELFDTLRFGCRVILPVTFQQVHAAPHTE